MKSKLILSLVLVLSMVISSYAARPLTVEDIGVVEKGIEIELSTDTNTVENISNEIGMVVNFAAGPNLQLGIEKPFIHQPYHPWGNGDTTVTAKYLFNDEWGLKAAAVQMDGDEEHEFGADLLEYSLTVMYGLQFGKLGVDTNLDYTFYDHPELCRDDAQNNWNLGIAFKYPLLKDITLVGQVTKMIVEDYLNNKADNHIFTRGGLSYEGFGFPLDMALFSATGKDAGLTIGATIPLEF